jgi:hypothetical protein
MKGGYKMFEQVIKTLDTALEDWNMMQKTSGDEGAEWAERFERHFYDFTDELQVWITGLDYTPKDIDEAEAMSEIKEIVARLPDPLQLNLTIELENILDGISTTRYD